MLEAIIAVLVILWLIGKFALGMGAFIHILLVAAVVVLVFRFLKGGKQLVGWD